MLLPKTNKKHEDSPQHNLVNTLDVEESGKARMMI